MIGVFWCVWLRGFYTSSPGLHLIFDCLPFRYLTITCRVRHVRVSFVHFGRFCRRLTLLQHFWRWTLILRWRTIWSIVTFRTIGLDFFPCRYQSSISHQPSFCIHNRNLRFISGVSSSHGRTLWMTLQTRERGEWLNWITFLYYIELDYAPMLSTMDSPMFTSFTMDSPVFTSFDN